jgi:anthranilate phosphoribosyltransferase
MFAPAHHKAMRFVIPVRKELAVRTIFNFLGPLTNPAGARRQVIGVSDPGYVETIAGALALLGVERALVVSSQDALDEMSISAPTTVVEVDGADIRTYTVTAADVGLPESSDPQATAGGSPEDNAATTRAILGGEQSARRDLAVLNAAAAIYAAGRVDDLVEGVAAAQAAIDDGAAMRTLDALVARTQELAVAPA